MSQTIIENAIVDTIKLDIENFNNENCKLNDHRSLGKGLERVVIVSFEAATTAEHISIRAERRTWTFNVDMLVPWRGELTEMDNRIAVETQKVIDILAQYPRLNGTAGIQRAELSAAAKPEPMRDTKGVYRGRRHTLRVLEIVTPGRLE
jgi:hypothetical protein